MDMTYTVNRISATGISLDTRCQILLNGLLTFPPQFHTFTFVNTGKHWISLCSSTWCNGQVDSHEPNWSSVLLCVLWHAWTCWNTRCSFRSKFWIFQLLKCLCHCVHMAGQRQLCTTGMKRHIVSEFGNCGGDTFGMFCSFSELTDVEERGDFPFKKLQNIKILFH